MNVTSINLPHGFFKIFENSVSEASNIIKVALKALYNPPQTEASQPLQTLEERELRKRDGVIWKCIRRMKEEKSGGYIYTFQLRDEFREDLSDDRKEALNAAQMQIFPAIEPGLEILSSFLTSLDNQQKEEFQKLLLDLGYSIYGPEGEPKFIIQIPDHEVLISRWKELREKNPGLPDLHIVPSEGIASDMEFVENFLQNDVTISRGREIFHDTIVHILLILLIIIRLGSNGYKNKRENAVKVIQELFNIILNAKQNADVFGISDNDMEKLEVALGWLTDIIYAYGEEIIEKLMDEGLEQFPSHVFNLNITQQMEDELKSFLHRRFPDEIYFHQNQVQTIWDNIFIGPNNVAKQIRQAFCKKLEEVKQKADQLEISKDEIVIFEWFCENTAAYGKKVIKKILRKKVERFPRLEANDINNIQEEMNQNLSEFLRNRFPKESKFDFDHLQTILGKIPNLFTINH